MKLPLLFAAALFPAIAVAGYTEYTLINFTECSEFLISTDLPLTYEQSKTAEEVAQRRYMGMIKKFSKTHDASWSEGLNVLDKDGKIHFGYCKSDYDQKGNRIFSLYCDGEETYPLSELRCKAGTGNRWFWRCSVKGKRNQDIRLYWVDTAEYEDGGPGDPNLGYKRDQDRMKNQCGKAVAK